MKKSSIFPLIIFFFAIGISKSYAQDIEWMSFEEAIKKTGESPRKIFVDVYTDWCGWCKVMDKNTFQNSLIAKVMNENFYCVKLNAEGRDEIKVQGRTYKFIANGNRGYHELAAELLNGKMSYPTVVFLAENLSILQALAGYHDAKAFEPVAHFFATDAYKTIKWEEFTQKFKSSF